MIQTPISFALDILLNCDTIEKAHKKCRKYIKILEAMGNNTPIRMQAPTPAFVQSPAQAPSTQRLLDAHAPTPAIPPAARIVGGEVNTGGGTTGPRKW